MSIILLACFLPIAFIIYFVMRNETKPKKNLILGVTLPHDARSDPAVACVIRKFLIWQDIILALLLLLLIPQFFFEHESVVLTWYMTWIILAVILPWIPFAVCNRTLRALKRQNSWFSESTGITLVDTKLAAAPKKMLGVGVFIPTFLISLVPVAATILTMRGRDEFWPLLAVYLSLALSVAAFYFIYRNIYQKAEVVDGNTTVNAALTQVRRYNWAKCWLWTAYLTSLFTLILWLLKDNALFILGLALLYSAVLIAVVMRAEFRIRKVQQKLSEESGKSVYTDDDDKWLFGLLYHNPNDNHFMVNRRTGLGTSMNLAKTSGKSFAGLVILVLLSMPFFGVWMMRVELTPVRLETVGTQIVATHTGTVYTIDPDSVTSAYLLDKLPNGTRTMGTGMDTVMKGNFRFEGIGDCRLCLDPRVSPFIVAVADGRTYILGSSDVHETRSVYTFLENRGVKKAS